MTQRRFRPLLFLVVAIFLAFSLLPAGMATAGENFHYVRLPKLAAEQVAGLGITPHLAIDYGSFLWLEVSSADYARLAATGIDFTAQPQARTVQVNRYRFDPQREGEPELAANLKSTGQGAGFRLVQFAGPVQDAWLSALEGESLRVLQYYPTNSFLVWDETLGDKAASGLDFVRWVGDYHPGYKIAPDMAERSGLIRNVDVMFYNDGNIKATLDALVALGASLLQYYPAQPDQAFFSAVVEMDASALEDAARINTVLWLGFSGPEPVLDDEMSSQIVAGNHPGGVPVTGYYAHLAGLGYDGSGVRWATVDTGVDYDHPDLNGHIAGGYSFPGACNANPGDDCAGGGHGTHVTGIMGGTGQGDGIGANTDPNGFLYGLGMAPGYEIFAMNSLSAPSWPPAGGWQEHSKRAVLGGAIGGNNSWTTGEGTQHGYQASERTHDIMVLDGNFDTTNAAEPFIEVFSAGNSGSSGLTAPKEGKNLIVTASSRNYRVGSIDLISSFSSRGPAVDGRWVPTIAAPGEEIASTRNDLGGSCGTAIGGTNGLYSFCSGTSMAAPHTSGTIVLATEWWRSFNGGADPSSAMAKALLVNGAVDMGTADIPNINEGWGRINITNIIQPQAGTEYWDQPVIFGSAGESWTLQVGVSDPTKPLKITLAWADAPGAVGANPALVNNLDLTVVNGGNTYLGNVFSGGWSQTGGTADAINNLENVYIQTPGGSATITVDAVNIAGDAILYNADPTDQSFALVCQNCALFPDFGLSATPPSLDICAPADAQYTIDVESILGYNDPVTLSTVGEPAGTTVNFSTNPVIPAGSSQLTIGNTGAAAAGSYSIDVVGVAPTSTHTTTVGLNLATLVPAAPGLVSPANGALNVPAQPTFTWSGVAQSNSYSIEIANDSGFSSIVDSASGIVGTSYTTGVSLNTSSTYFWRVWADNACGSGAYSATFSFTTEAAPGDCGPGTLPSILFGDDFESGAPGWTTSGPGTTWALGSGVTGPHSGSFVYHANDVSTVSDQYLVSPAVALPAGQNPLTVKFWNYQQLEDRSSGCYDGGVIEVTTNGGGTWIRLESELLTDPYDGPISSSFSNPLGGQNAWCGDPQDWLNSIVDLSAFAGQTVQVRWRLATDSSVSHPGWDIDDVVVQSCAGGTLPPNIDVNPLAMTSIQDQNTVTVQALNVGNTGEDDLNWMIVEDLKGLPDMPREAGSGDAAQASEDIGAEAPASTPAAPVKAGTFLLPEDILYDNGPLVTHPAGGFGGADASALQTALGLSTYGFGHQVSAGNRIADDFTVPDAQGWYVDTITLFAYQTGSTVVSTFTAVNLQIWDGPPDNPASSVVFGDTTTNRLAASDWSNIYRVLDTDLANTQRPVMANQVTIGTFLPAGTYWLDWQVDGTLASGPWAPPISILGQTTTGNAKQFTSTGWADVIDTGAGAAQGFPFIVEGTVGGTTPPCVVPDDIPWLSVNPASGATAGGGSTPVDVIFDSTGLAAGTYLGNLCITSNDPNAGPGNGTDLVIVPVTLTVEVPTAVRLGGVSAEAKQAAAPLSVPVGVLPAAMAAAMAAAYLLRRRR